MIVVSSHHYCPLLSVLCIVGEKNKLHFLEIHAQYGSSLEFDNGKEKRRRSSHHLG